MHSRRIALLLSMIAAFGHLPAQQAYFQEENFPSSASEIKHIEGIAADKNNCIWFTTQTGVYRYDGTRFRHYSVLNTPALKFERLTNVAIRVNNKGYDWCLKDAKSNLYEVDSLSHIRPFISKPGEQIIYEKFSYHTPDPQKNRIAQNLADSLFETYIIPETRQTFLLLSNGNIVSMPTEDFLNGGKGTIVYSFKSGFTYNGHYGTKTAATHRNFYILTDKGILRWTDPGMPSQRITLSGDILENRNLKIDYADLNVIKTSNPDIILFWYKGDIYEAIETGDSRTLHTRLLIREKNSEQPVAVFYSPAQQLFISYYINRGLIFYRSRQFSLLTGNAAGAIPGTNDYYYSVIASDSGFITVNDSGILWLSTNGERRILSRVSYSKYFLFKDKAGNIWYDDNKNQFIGYLQAGTGKPVQLLKTTFNNILIGVYQPDDSTYYLLTNRLFSKITLKEGVITATKYLYKPPSGIEFNVLFPLDDHVLWLGSDKGLIEFNMAGNRFKKIEELGDVYVRSAIKLNEGNYLLGTYDRGIYQFKDKRWMHLLSQEKNLPASAHAFISDEPTSSLWVSSNEGIIRLSLKQLLKGIDQKDSITFGHFTNFGSDVSSEFNGSSNASGAKLSDTCLAFTNANGLVVFNPSKIVAYPLPVNVLIESGTENGNDSLSGSRINSNHIDFNPVVPYFGNVKDIEVLYHLTNSNDPWHKLSPNSAISYNNLTPGDHELQFRIKHYHDDTGKEVFLTAKQFSVSYRWYEKSWFSIIAIVFVLLVLVSFHYLRIWYILKRRRELEKLIKLKTIELQESNENLLNVIEELSASEANLKQSNFLKDEYYAVLTHDIRSPLKFLSFNISQLLELLPSMNNQALKKGLYAAYQCSADVYKIIDEFVFWIRNNENQLKVQPVPTIIEEIVADTKKMYDLSLESNGNTLVSNVSPHLKVITDPKLLFIILRNAIDNANKYSQNGTITVSAKLEKGNLQINISDTGRGINEHLVKDLTELQYREGQISYKERRSLGFYIMAMLTKKLGGNYSINSQKGQGTSLDFVLPELKQEK